MGKGMIEIRKEMLETSGIDKTLESMILEKDEYLEVLTLELEEIYRSMLDEKVVLGSEEFWVLYTYYRLKQLDIEDVGKEIDSLCYYYRKTISIPSSKKRFRRSWDNIMLELEDVRIEDVVSRYTEVKNPRKPILCPIHGEKTPSLKLYLDTNSFYCFGCCKGGAPVNFVMLMEGMTFKEAVKYLLNH
jgi:hypothetical protein